MQTAISRMTHDLRHEAEPSLRRHRRVRPVGLETVREKPEGGMGIPGGQGRNKHGEAEASAELSFEITSRR